MSVEEFTIDNIETKIMSILYANIDTTFNQFALFNKLIKDKFPEMYNTTINPIIKARFLIVLRSLMSRYDDVKVSKDNNVYTVVCVSDKDKTEFKTWQSEPDYVTVNTEKSNKNSTSQTTQNQNTQSVPLDYGDMLNYIIENNLTEDMNYVDPFDGNTIYHDLVVTNNVGKITSLVSSNKFNFFIKNKHEQTPIELCTNQSVSNILIMGLMKKYLEEIEQFKKTNETNTSKISTLETTVFKYESIEYKKNLIIDTPISLIFWIKFMNVFEKNKLAFIVGVISTLTVFIFSK